MDEELTNPNAKAASVVKDTYERWFNRAYSIMKKNDSSETMEDRTLNIIFIIKRLSDDPFHMIAKYMSIECDYPIEEYTAQHLRNIVQTAFLDYIRHVPSIEAYKAVREFLNADGSDLKRMVIALGLCEVKDGHGNYIQGFKAPTFDIDSLEETEFERVANSILSEETVLSDEERAWG